MSVPRVLLVLTVTAFIAIAVQKLSSGTVRSDQTVDFPEGQYAGELHNGVPHGEGIFKRNDGRTYQGKFVHGRLEGPGSVTFLNGTEYNGDFRNGNPSGEGTLTKPDGSWYEGNFTNGKLTGSGSVTFPDGQTFEGQFVDGNPVGPGECTSPEGDAFSCHIQDGQIIR